MLTWPFHERAMSITGELVFHIEMDFLNIDFSSMTQRKMNGNKFKPKNP